VRVYQPYTDKVQFAQSFLEQLEQMFQSGSQAAKAVVRAERVPAELRGAYIVRGRKGFDYRVTNLCHALVVLECESDARNIYHDVGARLPLMVAAGS
jgi:hypothetical protein